MGILRPLTVRSRRKAASRTARRPQFTLRSRLGGVSKGDLLRLRRISHAIQDRPHPEERRQARLEGRNLLVQQRVGGAFE